MLDTSLTDDSSFYWVSILVTDSEFDLSDPKAPPEESDLVRGNEVQWTNHFVSGSAYDTLSDTPVFTTADESTNSDLNTQTNFGDNEYHSHVS